MNWNKVQKDYPLSFKALIEDGNVYSSTNPSKLEIGLEIKNIELFNVWSDGAASSYNIRNLYDFFDSVGIGCHYDRFKIITITTKDGAYDYISDSSGNYWLIPNQVVTTEVKLSARIENRTEAETLLFTQAFKIYNNQLASKKDVKELS